MYHSTGLTKARILDLCARIEARELSGGMRKWPPILGLQDSLAVTLKYLRRNRVQAEIAEDYGVSQPTISRAISAITPLLVQVLLEYAPTADDLDEQRNGEPISFLVPDLRHQPQLPCPARKEEGCIIILHQSWVTWINPSYLVIAAISRRLAGHRTCGYLPWDNLDFNMVSPHIIVRVGA